MEIPLPLVHLCFILVPQGTIAGSDGQVGDVGSTLSPCPNLVPSQVLFPVHSPTDLPSSGQPAAWKRDAPSPDPAVPALWCRTSSLRDGDK